MCWKIKSQRKRWFGKINNNRWYGLILRKLKGELAKPSAEANR